MQWLYFGYLAGVKEQNGAAMSLGRTTTFLDVYFERDLAAGTLTESQAQEIIDDFVIKLRIVRFLRTPEYDDLFAGDPDLGHRVDRRHGRRRPLAGDEDQLPHPADALQPRSRARAEPHHLVLAAPADGFRRFAAKVAIDTSSLQFESDEIMRSAWGDDGAIACCVSPMLVGKQMQFFGARANLAKCLLYAINGGRDEISGDQVAPTTAPVQGDYLDFDDVLGRFDKTMDWLAGVYVNAMNIIHYMHDKYAYERVEMALHDYAPMRTMAFGIAGLSVVADSLSAIKHAKVRVVRDETGLVTDYQTEGEFPVFGNNDNRVDQLAVWLVSTFMHKLRQASDVSRRDPHPVDPHDHLERRLRQGDRQHAGRAPARRAVRAGGQPDARPRQPRHPCVGGVGRQDSVSRRRGRHLAHDVAGARRAWAASRPTASRTSPASSTRSSAAPATT